jgi:hypothetical protein
MSAPTYLLVLGRVLRKRGTNYRKMTRTTYGLRSRMLSNGQLPGG